MSETFLPASFVTGAKMGSIPFSLFMIFVPFLTNTKKLAIHTNESFLLRISIPYQKHVL